MHESVAVRGPVGRLHGELEHHPYADISDHLRKIDSYTTLWARQAHGAGRRTNVVDVFAGATWAFFRNYVLKRGFLLGSAGLLVSVLNTHYTFVKLAKLRELATSGDASAMSLAVVHVDTARGWRGGQNQVLLTALGMAARGVATEIACRRGGELEARARAAGAASRPVSFRGDLWPAGHPRAARAARRRRPRACSCCTIPHAVSAGPRRDPARPPRPARGRAPRRLPAARRPVAREVRRLRPRDRREPRDRRR